MTAAHLATFWYFCDRGHRGYAFFHSFSLSKTLRVHVSCVLVMRFAHTYIIQVHTRMHVCMYACMYVYTYVSHRHRPSRCDPALQLPLHCGSITAIIIVINNTYNLYVCCYYFFDSLRSLKELRSAEFFRLPGFGIKPPARGGLGSAALLLARHRVQSETDEAL